MDVLLVFDVHAVGEEVPERRLIYQKGCGKVAVEEIPGGSRVIYEILSPAKKAFPPWVVRIGLYLVLPGVAQDFYERIKPKK